jgi:hypothetical protein
MLTLPQTSASLIVIFTSCFAKFVLVHVELLLVGATLARGNAVRVPSQGFPLLVNSPLNWEEQRENTPQGTGAKKAYGIPICQSFCEVVQ